MKSMRRTISAALVFLMLAVILIPSAAAFKNGDVVNYYLFTDIVTYINNVPIRSYNIDGYTAVIVEDLANYGFDVVWSAGTRTLSVTRNASEKIIGGFEPGANKGKVGSRAGEGFFTDIVTYFDGQAVKSYNVGGRTIAYVDDLAEFYKDTYVWDPYARTLSLTLRGAPTPPPSTSPLAITAQPKNAVANKGDAVSFEVTVNGGTAPYSYQWQVKQGSAGSWSNTTYKTRKMSIFVSDDDLNKPNYYRCIIMDSESNTATSDAVYVSSSASGTFKASLPFETISVFSTEVFTISVSVAGGAAPYKYQWYHGTSASSYSAISSTAMTISFKPDPSPATQYLKCAVIDSNGSVAETPPLVITLKDTTLKAKLDKTNISVAVNEVFTINCSVTGGTSPYSYKWFFGDKNGNFTDMTTYYTPVSAVTGNSITAKPDPNHPVQYLKCQVTDNAGIVVFSDVCTIFLNALLNPPVATLNKTSIVVDVNETLTLNCSVTGGTSPYTYKWFFGDKNGNFTDMTTYYNPVSAVTGNSITARPDPNHSIQYLKCQVTDNNGIAVFSNVCTITLTMAPLTATLDRESISVLSLVPFTITCEAEGGLAPYKYKWEIGYRLFTYTYYEDAGCTTKSITDHYPGDKSAYYYRCTVTDSKNNVVASNTCRVVKFTLPPVYP